MLKYSVISNGYERESLAGFPFVLLENTHFQEREAMNREHYEGFEREETFHLILAQALCECPVLKARTVKRIIAHVAPEFLDGLFEVRPCHRRLRYVGCGCIEQECPHGDSFFKMGQVYESLDFNGATYGIKGHDRRIGAAHFEWVRI
jgi:hypothetical protein